MCYLANLTTAKHPMRIPRLLHVAFSELLKFTNCPKTGDAESVLSSLMEVHLLLATTALACTTNESACTAQPARVRLVKRKNDGERFVSTKAEETTFLKGIVGIFWRKIIILLEIFGNDY